MQSGVRKKSTSVCECERPNARGLEMTVALINMLLLFRVTHAGTWCRLTDAPPWLALHPYRVKVRSHLPLFGWDFVGEIQSFQLKDFLLLLKFVTQIGCVTKQKLLGLKVTPVSFIHRYATDNRFFCPEISLMWPHLKVCHTEAFSFQRGLWVKCEEAVGRAVSANSFWQITKK